MVSRRLVFLASILATAVSFFTLGVLHTHRVDTQASQDANLDAIRAEVRTELGKSPRTAAVVPAGTSGRLAGRAESVEPVPSAAARKRMVAEIKQELQSEMGLLPVHLLRDRRSSFVELYSYDTLGKTNYGTAGYLGGGYFITVKHAVVALKDEDDRQSSRRIMSVKIVYRGKEIPARVIDTGDADQEVHSGDWRSSRRAISTCRRFASIRRSPTISPTRSSGSATTIRRGSSCRPATSARARRTVS